MSVVANYVSWILILLGSVFLITGSIGLLRMPDVFTRMHAVSLTDTMGAGLLIAGMAVQSGISLVTAKLLLILAFMFFATPTATHALAQTALSGGLKPYLREDRTETHASEGADEGAEP